MRVDDSERSAPEIRNKEAVLKASFQTYFLTTEDILLCSREAVRRRKASIDALKRICLYSISRQAPLLHSWC